MKLRSTKQGLKFTAFVCILFLFAIPAVAQKRKPPTKPAPKPKLTTAAANADIRAGAEKVSIQVTNLAKFVFVLGGVAKDIEAIDVDIRARKITRKETIDQNTRNKQAVVQTIQNLRAGLAALEIEFRTKAGLKPYLLKVNGIADICGNAEDQAANGQLTQSGNTLLLIIQQLSETLVLMP